MATFVLIHGGWHGGWCWRLVAPLLRQAGHAVHAPTLTGLGERAHLLDPRVDLDRHAHDIVNVLEYEDLTDVVLVGHSYGGMVVSGVAALVPERLAHLVYLDAFVPSAGQSLFDILLPNRREVYREAARAQGDGWRVPPPPVAALGISEATMSAWVAARLTPQPLATFEQAVQPAGPAAASLPRAFIHCTEGVLAPSFAPFVERARVMPGWTCHELATGHDAMLVAPREVADLLLTFGQPG